MKTFEWNVREKTSIKWVLCKRMASYFLLWCVFYCSVRIVYEVVFQYAYSVSLKNINIYIIQCKSNKSVNLFAWEIKKYDSIFCREFTDLKWNECFNIDKLNGTIDLYRSVQLYRYFMCVRSQCFRFSPKTKSTTHSKFDRNRLDFFSYFSFHWTESFEKHSFSFLYACILCVLYTYMNIYVWLRVDTTLHRRS